MFISQASKRRRFCQLVLVRNTANDSHDDQNVNNVRRMQISWDVFRPHFGVLFFTSNFIIFFITSEEGLR